MLSYGRGLKLFCASPRSRTGYKIKKDGVRFIMRKDFRGDS